MGRQLKTLETSLFNQLKNEILADSALLKGNNSYGYLDKTADLVGSTHYKGMGSTYQNVLVQPAKDYVSKVAESAKNTVVSSAKTVYQKAVVQNVPGLPGYEGAQADKAQSLLMQSRIEAGDAATINAGVSQIANATDRLLDGDPKAVGSVIGNTALLVTPVIVSKGASLIAEIQEASAATVAEARATTQVKAELNSRVDDALQYDHLKTADGKDWDWQKQAPNNGAVLGSTTTTTVRVGDVLDRYGLRKGQYMSPADTPLEQRSLPPGKAADPFEAYEVLKPFNVVKEKIARAFDQPGGGIQLRATISEVENRFATVDDLIRFKYLKDPKVNP
jgi:hypothetical protein